MSSKHSLDALGAARQEIGTLRKIIAGVVAMACLGMYLAHEVPANMTLHLAPNIRAADQVQVTGGRARVPEPNVYAFGLYIWQQVNRWAKDGAKDYESQVFLFQHYITPACQQQLRNDRENRSRSGELFQRTRSMNEVPGQVYSSARVIPDGPNAWTVLLDMQLLETSRGVPVKDAYLRYPLRVVHFDVDREKNPFQLALDCFGGNRPERLDPSAMAGTGGVAPTAAPLPSTQASSSATSILTPTALPREPASTEPRP